MVNALTHGNEFCGMVAVCHLLDSGVRPKIGTLTLSFANVAAYETFDPAKPFDSRLITHNLNRIWSPAWLEAAKTASSCAARAKCGRPSRRPTTSSTSTRRARTWCPSGSIRRSSAMPPSRARSRRHVHLVMPAGLGSGTPLVQHGAHGRADGAGAALVVECGQHFKQASADVATDVALNFLAHFGLVDRPAPQPAAPPRRFELLRTHVIQHPSFAFVRPVIGFETFAEGELIATDGPVEIRAPSDDCTIFMPARMVDRRAGRRLSDQAHGPAHGVRRDRAASRPARRSSRRQ